MNIRDISIKVSERTFHKNVADYLARALPPDCYATTVPAGDGQAVRAPGYRSGCPDYLLVFRGRPIFIELKTKDGKLSKVQQQSHVDITLAGGLVFTARNLNEIEDQLSLIMPLRARVEV